MDITLRLLRPLKDAVGKDTLSVKVENGTVISLLEEVSKDYPALGKEVLNDEGDIDYRINVILNDKPLTDLDVEIKQGDTVTLFIPISGGCRTGNPHIDNQY